MIGNAVATKHSLLHMMPEPQITLAMLLDHVTPKPQFVLVVISLCVDFSSLEKLKNILSPTFHM